MQGTRDAPNLPPNKAMPGVHPDSRFLPDSEAVHRIPGGAMKREIVDQAVAYVSIILAASLAWGVISQI
jgi:hypothetical protein